ncbi:MAG: sugar isomerase domain-containing protein [Armatimonadetes bacterium]|nr:sugar isomerase domain-containing protein [Armatimonadota bacterium]
MLAVDYLNVVREVLDRIQQTQLEGIDEAAALIAASAVDGGAWHLHDTGHMVSQELIHRAGGLLLITPLTYSFGVNNPVRASEKRQAKETVRSDRIVGVGQRIIESSNMAPGDVLMIGSVSGRNASSIDLALAAREAGIKVVAVTSLAYSSSVASTHPSGLRLFEAADVALDNCGVPGDAALGVAGLDTPFGPTSGIGAACVCWCVCAQVVQRLLAMGHKPHVFKSANLDGGPEFNRAAEEAFRKSGL